ncbi:DUF2249 domain-containing protein [Agrobacterium pusense]|uniref:DUF2249 domain-containing protein n=1 Tax=Agrobacterium pusense TaxID=648995 RepID=A0AA44EGF6_9HYPH|nr:DUF2249 domain-containing protein [Agrobacterium pusense]NRF07529.1 DUF2249 domain-containing protein [Agrobacterium pusense]NRF18261.1 DUF2249 domain-containing protein [Agrobacterium pusense]
MTEMIRELDVRPLLLSGGEPFPAIMEAVAGLAPGEALRLYATFRPSPLFKVMAERGFNHQVREIGGGDWEVLFTPQSTETEKISVSPALAGNAEEPQIWPDPVIYLDLSDEATGGQTTRTLAALDRLPPGAVIFVLMPQEPTFLYPELLARGHQWAGNFDEARTAFRIFIRAGAGAH